MQLFIYMSNENNSVVKDKHLAKHLCYNFNYLKFYKLVNNCKNDNTLLKRNFCKTLLLISFINL